MVGGAARPEVVADGLHQRQHYDIGTRLQLASRGLASINTNFPFYAKIVKFRVLESNGAKKNLPLWWFCV